MIYIPLPIYFTYVTICQLIGNPEFKLIETHLVKLVPLDYSVFFFFGSLSIDRNTTDDSCSVCKIWSPSLFKCTGTSRVRKTTEKGPDVTKEVRVGSSYELSPLPVHVTHENVQKDGNSTVRSRKSQSY